MNYQSMNLFQDNGYLCVCLSKFIDQSPDPVNKPGRICALTSKDECKTRNDCSPNAFCVDTDDGTT